MFGRKNKSVSKAKMNKWVAKQRIELVVALLETGSYQTRVDAIEILARVNLIQVKEKLLKCLDDPMEGVARKAIESLEKMGITTEERMLVDACDQKWLNQKPAPSKKPKFSFLARRSKA